MDSWIPLNSWKLLKQPGHTYEYKGKNTYKKAPTNTKVKTNKRKNRQTNAHFVDALCLN